MKFTFDQTEDDIYDFTLSTLKSNKLIKHIGLGLLILILVNTCLSLVNNGLDFGALFNWIYPIILFTILWIFFFKAMMKRRFRDPNNKNLYIGNRTIEIADEEILIETPLAKSEVKWPAISKFRESKKSYLLYMGKSQAIIFPKRIFKSDKELNDFKNLVEHKLGL